MKDMYSLERDGTDINNLLLKVRADVLRYILTRHYVTSTRDLPRWSGVYFVVDKRTNAVIYIGKSVCLHKRWQGHDLRHGVNQGAYRIHYEIGEPDYYFGNRLALEAFLICAIAPRMNRLVKLNGISFNTSVLQRDI